MPGPHKGLATRERAFASGDAWNSPRFSLAVPGPHLCLFVLRRGRVLPYLKVAAVMAAKFLWMIWTLAAPSARF